MLELGRFESSYIRKLALPSYVTWVLTEDLVPARVFSAGGDMADCKPSFVEVGRKNHCSLVSISVVAEAPGAVELGRNSREKRSASSVSCALSIAERESGVSCRELAYWLDESSSDIA